jgi:hypothetical protein
MEETMKILATLFLLVGTLFVFSVAYVVYLVALDAGLGWQGSTALFLVALLGQACLIGILGNSRG